jgi:hypothetical protein
MVSTLVIFKLVAPFNPQSFGRVEKWLSLRLPPHKTGCCRTGLEGKQVSGVLRRQTGGLNYPQFDFSPLRHLQRAAEDDAGLRLAETIDHTGAKQSSRGHRDHASSAPTDHQLEPQVEVSLAGRAKRQRGGGATDSHAISAGGAEGRLHQPPDLQIAQPDYGHLVWYAPARVAQPSQQANRV